MPDKKEARLDIINDSLGIDETVTIDVLALLFDPGGGLKKREAEGNLVLTDRRLIFGTAKHDILIDLAMGEIKLPVVVSHKFMMARLLVMDTQGQEHTLVVNKSTAQAIATAVNVGGKA